MKFKLTEAVDSEAESSEAESVTDSSECIGV